MFKKDLSVFLVDSLGDQYKLNVYEDVSYSQVFSEVEIKNKTLHNAGNYIDGGFTDSLNVGNFNFTIPLFNFTAFQSILSLIFQNNPEAFDLYLQNNKILKLNKCVITSAVLNITKDSLITISISGNYIHSTDEDAIPGSPVVYSSPVYTWVQGISIDIAGNNISNIVSFGIELSNSIEWVSNNYMQDTGPSYRDTYYCTNKVINGNISKNDELNSPSYGDSVPLLIRIKSNNEIFLEFDFPSVLVTSRPELAALTKKGFDFRINNNYNNQIRHKGVNIL